MRVTVAEAAKSKGVTPQAVRAAIVRGDLKSKETKRVITLTTIDVRELEQWQPRQPNGHNGSKRKEMK